MLTITPQGFLTVVSVVTAVIALFNYFSKVHKWFDKQKKQDEDIKQMKEEQALICYAMSACLDGLIQLGANHEVSSAKDKLDKHLNQTAHR